MKLKTIKLVLQVISTTEGLRLQKKQTYREISMEFCITFFWRYFLILMLHIVSGQEVRVIAVEAKKLKTSTVTVLRRQKLKLRA